MPFRHLPMPSPVLLPLLNSLRLPLLSLLLLLPLVALSSSSIPPPSQIRICPLKCRCSQDGSSLACSNLSRAEVRHLFGSGGTPSGRQFGAALLNLSIVRSQLDSLDIFPPLERLLWLNLRENELERVEMEEGGESFSSLSRRRFSSSHFVPAFPSLVFLDLSQNLITSISRHSFAAFPNAEEIRLTANRIVSVEWEAFRLFRLRRLSLSANCLLTISEHILRFCPAIEELDLSYNHLSSAQSSSFFAAQHLRFLNLSHNRLHKFDYDSFSPLFQLGSLDLSWNNFTAIPPDIRQFVALRALNFSGNPIEKVAEGELSQPMLQTLQICDCPRLRLVERRAFAGLPNLQFLQMANNPRLQFVSPDAFQNNSLLFEVDFSNNSLSALSSRLLLPPVRLRLRSNPLLCGCIFPWLPKLSQKLADINEAICVPSAEGPKRQRISLAKFIEGGQNEHKTMGECPPEPILPMGAELRAKVGDFFSLYCAARRDEEKGENGLIRWTLPNGTELIGEDEGHDDAATEDDLAIKGQKGVPPVNSSDQDPSRVRSSPSSPSLPSPPLTDQSELHRHRSPMPSSSVFDSSFLGSLHPSLFQLPEHFLRRRPSASLQTLKEAQMPQPKPRIQVNGEQLRFEVLVSEDAGNYTCRVNGTKVSLRLFVEKPIIQLSAVEIGSHYVALVWNDSLKIRAVERVQLSLEVRDAVSQQRRAIQLSLHNPWHSYNVVRLRPLTNYTFCLAYNLFPSSHHSSESSSPIFKSCVDAQTEEQLGFWASLSPTTVGVLLALCFCLGALLCFRALYLRFYIWHEAKLRARMNQSMSGQSFLSHSSSLHHSVHQQLNNGQSANAIDTPHPSSSFSSPSSNFTSKWDERRCSPAQSLQMSGKNGKRIKKKRKEKPTALRLGATNSENDPPRGDGEEGGMDMAESIVLC